MKGRANKEISLVCARLSETTDGHKSRMEVTHRTTYDLESLLHTTPADRNLKFNLTRVRVALTYHLGKQIVLHLRAMTNKCSMNHLCLLGFEEESSAKYTKRAPTSSTSPNEEETLTTLDSVSLGSIDPSDQIKFLKSSSAKPLPFWLVFTKPHLFVGDSLPPRLFSIHKKRIVQASGGFRRVQHTHHFQRLVSSARSINSDYGIWSGGDSNSHTQQRLGMLYNEGPFKTFTDRIEVSYCQFIIKL